MGYGMNGNGRSWMAAGPEPAGASCRRRRRAARHRLSPMLLALEDRRLLATFHVTSTADDGSVGTLR